MSGIFRGPPRLDPLRLAKRDERLVEAGSAMACVYILKSTVRDVTYIGSTTDIERRLREHNSEKHTFTKRFTPWVVVYTEEFVDISEARKREMYLKSAAGRRYLKRNNCIPR